MIAATEPVTRKYGPAGPWVLILPLRFSFLQSNDRIHWNPPHVHVEREERQAKFWLDPIRLENSRGFRRIEIRQIERLVADNAGLLLEAWHEYFGN